MLNEQDRKKLDGIVQQMIANKEPEKTIQFVVNDFKSKYDKSEAKIDKSKTETDEPSWFKENVIGGYKRAGANATGAGKGVLSTLTGISSLGERGIKFLGRVVTPKKYEERLGFSKFEEGEKTSAETLVPEKFRTPEEDEKIGFAVEQIAEFFIPIPGLRVTKGAIYANRAKKLYNLRKASKLYKFNKATNALTKIGVESAEFSARNAAQEGEVTKEDVGTNVALFTVMGGLSPVTKKVINVLPEWLVKKAVGQKTFASKEGTDISADVLKKKLNSSIGSKKTIIEKSDALIKSKLKSLVNKISKNENKWIPDGNTSSSIEQTLRVDNPVTRIKEKLIKRFAKSEKIEMPETIFRDLVDDISKVFKSTNEQKSVKDVAKQIKISFDKISPGTGKKAVELYKETLFNKMFREASKGSNQLSLWDLKGVLTMGAGFVSGGLPGIFGGAIIKKAVESNALQLTAGLSLQQVKVVAEKALKKLSDKEREAIVKTIMGIINQTDGE